MVIKKIYIIYLYKIFNCIILKKRSYGAVVYEMFRIYFITECALSPEINENNAFELSKYTPEVLRKVLSK